MENNGKNRANSFEDRVTALGELEMTMFRFLLDKPAGVILTVGTDKMIAELLERDGLVLREPGDKVIVPDEVRNAYGALDPDLTTLKWRKRNWMYRCIEAGKCLYGVMTWDALKALFALRYPNAGMDEVKELFNTTSVYYQWFTERGGKLVLNGFEKDDYYKYLEQQIQGDIPFYVPTKEEIEELYDQGSLISRESHQKMKDFLENELGCSPDVAAVKIKELYETVNNHQRINEVVDNFTTDVSDPAVPGGSERKPESGEGRFAFESDEQQFRFIELYMEMSRECRIRDNRGHDNYEMVAIMAAENRGAGKADGSAYPGVQGKASGFGELSTAGSAFGSFSKMGPADYGRDSTNAYSKRKPLIKPAKIGRNDPCPCGSGKKYKNCCGRSLN